MDKGGRKGNTGKSGKDLVLTPGGMRPKESVHSVRPDEKVKFGAAGGAAIQSILKPILAADADILRSRGLVLTPGGFRSPDLVHKVGRSEILKVAGKTINICDKNRKVLRQVAPGRLAKGPLPELGSGWIAYASWTNNTGNPVTSFRTSWVVPPEPATKSSQTIFLFNGIDPSNPSLAILQPVLQWGPSAAGGGQYWSIASWYVENTGNAFHSNLIQVSAGNELEGLMTLTGQANGKFSYKSEFVGYANSSLTVEDVAELVWLNETLEAYSVNVCTDYPDTPYLAFQQIDVLTGATRPALNWSPQTPVTDCGQATVIASNANPGGEVDIYFRGRPAHDLYIRDNLQDFGGEPLIGGGLSCSPDIIVFNEELLDPQAALGSAAAQNQDNLGQQVESGQDNFLYFRLQNRGSQPADGNLKVYWADMSTWPIPGGWHLIGELAIPFVTPGEFKVIGPLKWLKGDIPPQGHYCFLSLIDRADDPAPDPAAISGWDEYYHFIRLNNNATWKNFNVVPLLPGTYTTFSFKIQGWPRKKLSSDLLIDLSLVPHKFNVSLRILRRLTDDATLQNMTLSEESQLYRRYQLKSSKSAAIRNMNLKASDATEATLEIDIPEDAEDGYHRFFVSQLVDGREMGRVTSLLAVGDYPFTGNTNTKEFHMPGCVWAARMSPRHKVAYDSAERAIKHGFNGCRYCLPEYSTD